MKDFYNWLKHNNFQWGRINPTTIYVWTSGYKNKDAYAVDKKVLEHGGSVIKMNFDRICGKTQIIIKHREV